MTKKSDVTKAEFRQRNKDLTAKLNAARNTLRRARIANEAQSKRIAELEHEVNDYGSTVKRLRERVKELEAANADK